jgi:hypothetical protein
VGAALCPKRRQPGAGRGQPEPARPPAAHRPYAQQVVNPLLGKFQSSLGTAGQANGYNSDVLSGKYMGGNPYLQQMLSQTNRDVTNNVNSQFEQSGRYGSDAHGYGLARGMADSENGLRYQNYSDEMNRMGESATNAARDNTVDISSLLSSIGAGAQMPYTGVSNLANSLGALFSGGTEKSESTGRQAGAARLPRTGRWKRSGGLRWRRLK